MYSKEQIFNLALGALLLVRRIINAETDKGNEVTVLRTHWETALYSILAEMDLDSTSTSGTLELIEEDTTRTLIYAYKYPEDCVFFRRIASSVLIDNRSTQIPKRIGVLNGEHVIFTNQYQAVGEWISKETPLSILSVHAGLAVAYKLAILSAPLIVGKGAKALQDKIEAKLLLTIANAQALDARENSNFVDDEAQSEWVEARMS